MNDEMQKKPNGCSFAILIAVLWACLLGRGFAGTPGGVFALQPGSHDEKKLDAPHDGRLISVSQLNTPGIVGVTVRGRRWDAAKNSWPLIPFYDGCQATAKRAGDRWTLLLMSGDSPDFTSEAYLRSWELQIGLLGIRYSSDPSLWGVHLTGCSPYGASEERHHRITPAIEAADKRLIRAWAAAFPTQKLLFAIGAKDDAGMKRLIQYAMAIAPGRVVVKSNAMKSTTQINAPHNQLIVWAGKQGAEIGFEMARADGNWPKVKANIAAIEKQAGRKIVYLAPYPSDLAKAGGLK